MNRYLISFTTTFLLLLPMNMKAELLVGDVNGDGQINMADVARLVDCVKNPKHYYGGVNYVDLGLPSKVLWATTNVGATKPEGYGDYFAWGETQTKDDYEWATYQWGTSSTSLTKYCTKSSYGTIDGITKVMPEDDIAHVSTTSAWHIPSFSDWIELGRYCVIWADSINHIHGYSVYSSLTKNEIFVPNSGYRNTVYIHNEGYDAFYWANETYSENSSSAYGYYLGSTYIGWAYRSRYLGFPIRPVIYPYERVCDINGDGVVNVADIYALAQQVIL